MKIFIGQQYEVLESGIVIGSPGETIAFELDRSSNFIVYFEFAPEGHWVGNVPILQAESVDKNSLLLKFDRFSYSQGHGNVEPLEVGTFNGKKLFLNYRIFSSPKGTYQTNFKQGGVTLMYTWLIGTKA